MTFHPIRIDSAGGEYMESVVILDWAVAKGQKVRKGALIVTVETAKAATEIEAEHDGWLHEIFFDVGQEAPVKAVLGTISDEEDLTSPPPHPSPVQDENSGDGKTDQRDFVKLQEFPRADENRGRRVIASPLSRRLACEAGINLAEIKGSGPHGRIKARDLAPLLANKGQAAGRKEPKSGDFPLPALGQARCLPVVLLHGFGADRSSWRQVLPLLPPSWETITLDLPGHGTQASVAATNLEELVFSISEQLAVLGQERVHLVGHSLGGAVALALASWGAVCVHSLTLLAPAGLGTSIHAGFIKGLIEADSPQRLGLWLRQMVADAYILPPAYEAAVFYQIEKNGNRGALTRLAEQIFPHGSQIFNLMPELGRLSIPTRILWGRDDRIMPAPSPERLPDFVAWHLLSDIGHVPQLEAPALTARLIKETVLSAG